MIRFETERLITREHEVEDIDDYHACVSDPDVMKYIIGFKRTTSIKESRSMLAEAIEYSLENPREKIYLAIDLKDTPQYIGSVGGSGCPRLDRLCF